MLEKTKKIVSTGQKYLPEAVIFDEIIFREKKRKMLKLIYRLYKFTASLIVVICFAVLVIFVLERLGVLYDDPLKDAFYIDDGTNDEIYTGELFPSKDTVNDSVESGKNEENKKPSVSIDTLYEFDYSAVPEGETPIIPMDLSLSSYGESYIHNSTGLSPDTKTLLEMSLKEQLKIEYLSASNTAPTVLILHTHGTEAYCDDGAISYREDGGDLARSEDTEKNVVAVGSVLADALDRLGIKSVHCEIMHDADGYSTSYARAEETIRRYLDQYPTIELVIDVHRDSVIKSSGEIVRPVTVVDGKAAAQVMCVVGSSWGGEDNPNWERNLALALQLGKILNNEYGNICRPPYLKSSTYNQEIAPCSLLLEIGSCGNSIEEATVSAEIVAKAIYAVLKK